MVLNIPLSIDFAPSFFKTLTEENYVLQDLAFVNQAVFSSFQGLDKMLSENKEEEFNQAMNSITFSSTYPNGKEVELIPNGKTISVTTENYEEYKKLILKEKLALINQAQYDLIKLGLNEYVPRSYLLLFSSIELRSLICSEIETRFDIEEWKKATIYEDCSETTKQVKWFWEVLDNQSNKFVVQVFQWLTGSTKFPSGGFRGRFPTIALAKTSANHLPTVSTCLCCLYLPEYPSKKILKEKLEKALEENNFGIC